MRFQYRHPKLYDFLIRFLYTKKLFDIIFLHAERKVVVMEPSFVSFTKRYGILGKFLGWVFKIIDDDGFNRIEYWFTDEKYQELFQSRFGSRYGKKFQMKYQRLGGHHLVTFTVKDISNLANNKD